MVQKPRYEVRVLGEDHRPVTNWQWCPDPKTQPLGHTMGLALAFSVPDLRVIAKGSTAHIEIRLDGRVIFMAGLSGIGLVRRGDTININELNITMETPAR